MELHKKTQQVQVSHQTKEIRKKSYHKTVKQYLSSDIRTTKKHSIASNTKEIQNYQTNIKT